MIPLPRPTMVDMTGLTEQLPHTTAFPRALGTGLLLHTASALDTGIHQRIGNFISDYENVLSRFRNDSIVGQMRTAPHGGSFDFPDWCTGLFDLYDQLFEATNGAIDPCVGEDLIRLGYDATYSFAVEPGASGSHLGAIHGRPTWANDVKRHGTTLITHRPVALDFGACGKGYLVDLIAEMLGDDGSHPQPATPPAPASGGEISPVPAGGGCPQDGLGVAQNDLRCVIDAGGDLLIHTDNPITIALEDPSDPANAVGVVELSRGAFCASSPSRRHWTDAAGHQLHHLLNAIDGLPVDDVAATWVAATPDTEPSATHPTATADGLATALFTTSASPLRAHFPFECAILTANRTAAQSPGFPGEFFTC